MSQRFSIYSKDPKIAFPIVEFSFKRQDMIDGIKAGTFPMDEVSKLFKRAAAEIQEAIKAGQTNDAKK